VAEVEGAPRAGSPGAPRWVVHKLVAAAAGPRSGVAEQEHLPCPLRLVGLS